MDSDIRLTLTTRGLRIPLKSLNSRQRKKISSDLVVQPEQYIGEALPYNIFEYDTHYVWVPRYYGITEFGGGDKRKCQNEILGGERREFNITLPGFQLKPIQAESLKYLTDALVRYGTAILKLECGVGKTVTGIYLINRLRTKTLVVVHRLNLLRQWTGEIQRFTNAKVGLLHRDTRDVDDVDIVVTTVQCVLNHAGRAEYAQIYSQFGMMIIDEAHHFSSREFYRTLKLIGTKYVVGLSATPDKGERTKISHVFKKFIGPIVPPANIVAKYAAANSNQSVVVNIVRYAVNNSDLTTHLTYTFRGETKSNVAGMITNIGKNDNRNRMIVNYIRQILNVPQLTLSVDNELSGLLPIISQYYTYRNVDERRCVLVVADRKRQLRWLAAELKKCDVDVGLYIGGMSDDELACSANCQVILGTYAVCEEGLNIPKINCVFLASPRRGCEQSIGRGFRKTHPIPIIIVDIVDCFSKTFVNQATARKSFYRGKNYSITEHRINSDKLPELKLSI